MRFNRRQITLGLTAALPAHFHWDFTFEIEFLLSLRKQICRLVILSFWHVFCKLFYVLFTNILVMIYQQVF